MFVIIKSYVKRKLIYLFLKITTYILTKVAYLIFVFDVVILNRVSDVKSAGPEDKTTGCRAFLIHDTYNINNVKSKYDTYQLF